MGKAYSGDLRQRIVEAVDGGMSWRQAAKIYQVSVSSAIRYVQRWRDTGSVEQSRMGPPGGSRLGAHGSWLIKLIETEPDITLSEISVQSLSEHQIKASVGNLWNFYNRNGFSFKKNRACRRTRTA
jgi:transposase